MKDSSYYRHGIILHIVHYFDEHYMKHSFEIPLHINSPFLFFLKKKGASEVSSNSNNHISNSTNVHECAEIFSNGNQGSKVKENVSVKHSEVSLELGKILTVVGKQ